jgi:glycine/D-amino acid oxidase-like deaminating enzyme
VRDRARVVVIGGGVGGCAILYWLTKLGWDDVVLVERADLTSGSTFHSAGLVGQLRGSLSLTKMMMSSVDLYRTLGEEVGLETGWHEVGSLRLASSEERMEEIARQAGWAKTFGLPLELISADEAQRLFPPLSTDGVLGAAYLPTDGYIDPSQLTFALAEGARRGGAEIATNTRVTGIDVAENRVRAVETDEGHIETEIAVDAGGIFAAEIGTLAGVVVPIVPMAHEYLITRPAGLPLELPTMRDPSLLVYFRGESGGLVMGGYERSPAPWGLGGIPPDFNGKLLEEDWERFEELMQNAVVRVPALAEAEVVRLVNGPEAFTPDGEFILGPTDVRGFWVAAGFCAHGLAGAGGMGKLVAEWIVEGLPSLDVWEMDSRRFGAHYASRTTHSLARPRSTRRTTTSSTRATSARPAAPSGSRPRTPGSRSSARLSARSPAGSGRTGSNQTPNVATSRCGRAAGPAATGRQRSASSTVPSARRRRSSTRRRLPRSRCRGAEPPAFWNDSVTTASRATSARSPTRRC